MHISKTIELSGGSVQFDGELNADELDLVLSCGLNFLFMKGALPFQIIEETKRANMQTGNETQN